MKERTRTYSIRLFVRWAEFIGHHSLLVLLLSLLATVRALISTVNHFRIDTEMTDMISDNLPYRKLEKEFQNAFPQFNETIVVVIDADTPESARFHDPPTHLRREFRSLLLPIEDRQGYTRALLYWARAECASSDASGRVIFIPLKKSA